MFITSVLFHFILYMQVVPTEQELPGLKQDSPPFILLAGELPNYDDIFIVAKGERILNVSGGDHDRTRSQKVEPSSVALTGILYESKIWRACFGKKMYVFVQT